MKRRGPIQKLVVPLPKIGKYLVESRLNLNISKVMAWAENNERERILRLLDSRVDHSAAECGWTCLTHRYMKLIKETVNG